MKLNIICFSRLSKVRTCFALCTCDQGYAVIYRKIPQFKIFAIHCNMRIIYYNILYIAIYCNMRIIYYNILFVALLLPAALRFF